MSTPGYPSGNTPEIAGIQPNTGAPQEAGATAATEEHRLIIALRQGDEQAFMLLVERYHPLLLRLALMYLPNRALAEEVVQETWIGVLQGIARFEGRSSLKTWISHILINRAKTHAQREGRLIPFSSLFSADEEEAEPTVAPERFLPPDHPQWPGHWVSFPQRWDHIPEEQLLSQETSGRIQQAIQRLPANQREVITLRDIEGWTSDEVCGFLGITAANQRVLLHRARAQVRHALEQYFAEE